MKTFFTAGTWAMIISTSWCHLFLQLLSDDNSLKIQMEFEAVILWHVESISGDNFLCVPGSIWMRSISCRSVVTRVDGWRMLSGAEICHSSQLNTRRAVFCLYTLICSIRRFVRVTVTQTNAMDMQFCHNILISRN